MKALTNPRSLRNPCSRQGAYPLPPALRRSSSWAAYGERRSTPNTPSSYWSLAIPTRKYTDQILTYQPCICEFYARRLFHIRVLLQEQVASRCRYYVRQRYRRHTMNIQSGVQDDAGTVPDFQFCAVLGVSLAFRSGNLKSFLVDWRGCRMT